MPFGYPGGFGGSYRQPAPTRLTLEELLGMQEQFTPPPRPDPITSLRDLEGGDRREAQQQSVFAGLAALGAGIGGDWRRAAGGIGDIQAAQQGVLAGANQRQDQRWQESAQQQAAQIAQEKKRGETSALFGVYEKIAGAEPPDSTLTQRAERAARSGSMAELQNLLGEVPKRAAARSKGYDPDAWETNSRLQADLEAELENAKRAATLDSRTGEKKALGEADLDLKAAETERLGGIKTAQDLAEEEEMRRRKLKGYAPPAPPQYEPLSRVAERERLVQGIRAEFDAKKAKAAGVTRVGQLADGSWAEIHRADETHPKPYAVPIDGQPEVRGNLAYYTKDSVRYVHDKNRPEAGAYPLEEHEEGSLPPPPPAKPDLRGLAPAAGGPAAKIVSEQATKKLSAVKDPGVLAKIQKARASGYSDSEIAAFLGLH